MEIIKSTGQRVEYDREKIRQTLRHAGASDRTIRQVLPRVEEKITDGMTTRRIYSILRREIRKSNPALAHRYNLRNALLKLGPAGFQFEKYVASILKAYQYETEIPDRELLGLCVRHEIDVIAKREGKTVMIEAKFRNQFGLTVSLKDVMATWAAFEDLVDGSKTGKCPRFDELWVVTNGRFSERAYQFGVCRGIRMVGWGSEEHSLARMVDHTALYPITVIDGLRQWELERLFKNDLTLCREVAGRNPADLARQLDIPKERVQKIILSCQEVISEPA
ncbi:restriction endonuclease [Candidatus Uhrbacteria bacterium]|nr:restriction endonuclease [Candidatus Uhrbacteria bacterium]